VDKRFFISFLNYSRNSEIYDIAWNRNKNVEKRKKLFPNVGYKILMEHKFRILDEKFNNIQNINKLHGFKPGEGLPEVSLSSNDQRLSTKKYDIVLDLNAHSLFENTNKRYEKSSFDNMIKNFSSQNTIELVYPNLYTGKLINSKNKLKEIKNLDTLIEVILNTNLFVCLNSGSHVLASGIKNLTGYPKKIISFNNFHDEVEINGGKIENKKGKFYFDNVHYEYIDIEYLNINKDSYDTQNISKKMDQYIKLNQIYLNLYEKYNNFLSK